MTPTRPLLTPQIPTGEEARVEAIFSQVEAALGFVPDALRLYSFSPALLEGLVGNIAYFMQHPRISAELGAMIRYLVSTEVGCQFCIDLNEGLLLNLGIEREALQTARDNPAQAPLEPREQSLLLLALQVVEAADSVSANHIEALKQQGWSEREIFDASVIATNNRALNQLLKAFNVEQQGSIA